MKKKTWFFKGIPVLMLVFGLVLASCGDDGGSDPTHEIDYALGSGGTLTIKGDGESSVPKDGDSFTLETPDGKKVTGTVAVAGDGTISFKNSEGTAVMPNATIPGGDSNSITIETGDITYDDGSTATIDSPQTVDPVLPPPPPASPTYDLVWGFINGATYSQISTEAKNNGASLTAAGSNAGYLAGTNALAAMEMISEGYSDYFTDFGSLSNKPFDELLDFNENGIGLPSALKTAMNRQKENLPIAAVFQVNAQDVQGVVVFFVVEAGSMDSETKL
jgi:hypothetical protein